MLQDVPWSPPPEDDIPEPSRHLNVTSDVAEIVTYRQGYLDACDGCGPFRDAWAYRRGWSAGARFRSMVSAEREPFERHFPGWPSLGQVYTTMPNGGPLPRSIRSLLARYR